MRYDKELKQKVIGQIINGVDLKVLSKKHSIPIQTLRTWRRNAGVIKRQAYDDDLINEVTLKLLQGQSSSKLAKEYSIPLATIKNWRSKKVTNERIDERTRGKLGDMVLGLVGNEIRFLNNVLNGFVSPHWLEQMDNDHLCRLERLVPIVQEHLFTKLSRLNVDRLKELNS